MKIKPYPKNAKKHPQKQIEQIAESIREFGMNQPIVVDKDGVIIVGHGRYAALQHLGWEVKPEWVMTVDLTPEQANAYRLADNKLNESDWELEKVIEELRELPTDLAELTGFDLSILEEKYDDYRVGSIAERFLVAPFSVLDTRRGEWQARKKKWLALGIKSEEGRPDDLLGNVNYFAEKDKENKKKRASGLKLLTAKQNATYNSGIGLTGTSIFDPVLCELMYLWFAPPNATIVDPFAGGSVRGVVASVLGHQYMGTELRTEQVDANRAQASDILTADQPTPVWQADDAMNIQNHFGDVQFDMLLTCPPYADLEVYSADPRDISTMEYSKFNETYRDIIKRSTALLKDNTFAVCVVGEVRDKNGGYYNFVGDTIKAFEDAGLHYYNEIILVNMVGTLGMRITKQFSSGRKIGKTHQNVLVFWKGDPKNVKKTVSEWDIKGDIFADDYEETE
jgi:ParB-like chromosome segregation protein Spo0J